MIIPGIFTEWHNLYSLVTYQSNLELHELAAMQKIWVFGPSL